VYRRVVSRRSRTFNSCASSTSQGHCITFLDLAEGGGDEMGKECSGGAELGEGSCMIRALWVCAVSRRAGFVAGGLFFVAPAVWSGCSRRGSAVIALRSGSSSAEACRLAEAVVLGADFEADSSRLAALSFASAAPAMTTGVSEAVEGSGLGACVERLRRWPQSLYRLP
jgi:hypothetical protein